MTLSRRAAVAAVRAGTAVAIALLAAGCGTTSAATSPAALPTTVPLGTSLGGQGQPGWAAVQMGGSQATFNNFWELFARPAGSARWELATPLGVASNGGLVMSTAGAGLVAGFRPSQDLLFSPLADTASAGGSWSPAPAPVNPGLASDLDALAAGPGGRMLALTDSGEVLAGSDGSWQPLATVRKLAGTAAGRACGLTALTAVAFTAAGTPLLGGQCARPGTVGLFAAGPGSSWQAAGPAAAGRVTVLGLATHGGRTTALVAAVTGTTSDVIAAWSATGTSGWALSAPASTGGRAIRSVSLWASGGAGIALAGGTGATIAGPGASWQPLASLPARTATLALGPDGQVQALAVNGSRLTVWQLTGREWARLQVIVVKIPYGSSD
ncbi:MAG TPA: hypothetical protein VEL03_08240 [Streptosporangiaceae bacterium]|nr:hypothetical protein [Streptosporangiaceae bacterium]